MLTLLYPMRSYLVLSGTMERPNVMTADWVIPVSFYPEMVAVAIGKTRYTRELVDAYGEMVIAVPTPEMRDLVLRFGTVSGRHQDKLAGSGLTLIPSKRVRTPSLKEAAANVELIVRDKLEAGDHVIYVGEIVGHTYDERYFPGGTPSPDASFVVHLDLGGDLREMRVR